MITRAIWAGRGELEVSANRFSHSNFVTRFFSDPHVLQKLRKKVIFSPNVVNLMEALITVL